jgi:hypothetical protein
MRETTTFSRYMMRFPRIVVYDEQKNKPSQENAISFSNSIRHIQLGQQEAVSQSKCLQNQDSNQTDIQKFQADSHPFRIWKEFFLLHNESIATCRTILLGHSLKYLNIATMTHGLEKTFLSTETSIFPNISKVVERSEN